MTASPPNPPRPGPRAGQHALSARPAAYLLALAGLVLACGGCSPSEDEIRARAADDFQCGRAKIGIEPFGASTWLATGCGQSDQYTCATEWHYRSRELVCTRSVPSSAPLLGSTPVGRRLLDSPSGAGGFAFGASEQDVRRACEQAGHAYSSDPRGASSCDGVAADVGAPARATLAYCGRGLCEVSMRLEPPANEDLGHALAHWKRALVNKYGGPSASQDHVPEACRGNVTPCLLDRTADIQFDWQWGSRQSISLSTQVDDAGRGALVIAYLAPAAVDVKPKNPGL